jgi:hypothetical protein
MDFVGSARPLSDDGLVAATEALGASAPAIWAVLSVETHGCGFLPDRRPTVLFERHVFHKQTGGRFDASHPAISASSPGGYLGGANEYTRLGEALALDAHAALSSASWGLGQIMGFNARLTGFKTAEAMVSAMIDSEDAQLEAMARFLQARHLDRPLARRSWAEFARGYNGPSYKKNQYDTRLAAAYAQYARGPRPDLSVRAAQLFLTFLGYAPGVVDGILGKRTRSAIVLFREGEGLGSSDGVDEMLIVSLGAAAGRLGATVRVPA